MSMAPVTATTQRDIFVLLVEQEELIGALYKVYQKLFPELDAFWGPLAEAEYRHAALLQQLAGRIDSVTLFFDPGNFNTVGLRTSCEHVRKQIQFASTQPITLLRTLATAMDLETSLIEKEFFRVATPETPAGRMEFQTLLMETQEHRGRIAARLAEERERQ